MYILLIPVYNISINTELIIFCTHTSRLPVVTSVKLVLIPNSIKYSYRFILITIHICMTFHRSDFEKSNESCYLVASADNRVLL